MVTTRSHLQKTHAQQHGSYTTPKLGRRPLPVLPIPRDFSIFHRTRVYAELPAGKSRTGFRQFLKREFQDYKID
jgi:hypothetical protein